MPPVTDKSTSERATDEAIRRLGDEIRRSQTTQERPPDPPTYGPPEQPPHTPGDPPHTPTTYTSETEFCCGLKGNLLTYPRVSDPMNPPPELEAPREPAVGGVQVYLHDGAFFTDQNDLSVPALFYDMVWSRHWRGDATFTSGGLLGHGWDFAFNKRIVPLAGRGLANGLLAEQIGIEAPKLMYYNGTGRAELYPGAHSEPRTVLNFDKSFRAYVTTYKSPPGQFHEIERYVLLGPPSDHPFRDHPDVEPLEQIFYVLREKNGTRYVFNCRGQLIFIVSRNDSPAQRIRVQLLYGGKLNPLTQNRMLSMIVDATGRQYGVQTVDIDQGKMFTNIKCKLVADTLPIPRIKTVTGAGITITYSYHGDRDPVLESATIAAKEAPDRRWEYKYNGDHRITEIKDPNESAKGTQGKPYLENVYAGARVQSQKLGDQELTFISQAPLVERDAAGSTWTYELEEISGFHVIKALTVTDADKTHGGMWTTRYRYNLDTQVTEITFPVGNGISFEYQNANAPVTVGPIRDWVERDYTYENNLARGNLLSVTRHGPAPSGPGPARATTVAREPGISYSGPEISTIARKYDKLYNQLTDATDALDNVTTFSYTDYDTARHRGNPLRIEYPPVLQPDGSQVRRPAHVLTYNQFAQEETVDEGDGRITKYEYHPDTRYMREIQRPGGATETLEFDPTANVTKRTTPDGTVQYSRDGFGQLKRKTVDPDGLALATVFAYDHNGNTIRTRVEVKDTFVLGAQAEDAKKLALPPAAPYWQTVATEYDLLGRKQKVTLSGESLSEATVYKYTRAGDVEYRMGPKLDGKTPYKTTYRHDARHLPVEVIEAADTKAQRVTRRQYDPNGNVTLVETQTGNAVSRRTLHYNSLDRVDTAIDPLGALHQFTYDAAGNVVALAVKGTGGAITLRRIGNTYDAYEHVIQQKAETLAGTPDETTQWFYSGQLTLAKTVAPNGGITSYRYDAQKRVEYVTDPAGNEIHNVYDGRGNLEKVDLTSIERTFRPGSGTADEKKTTATTTTGYDRVGRIVKVTTAAGTEQRFLDSLGRARATLSSAGHLSTFVYDGLGRQSGMEAPLVSQRATYTEGGLVDESHGPQGEFRFTYDPLGRIASHEDLRTKYKTTFEYADRTVEMMDRNGTVVKTVYNAGGLPETVTAVKVGDEDVVGGVHHEQYVYDELGRVTRARAGYEPVAYESDVRRSYDGLDRVTEEIQAFRGVGQTIKYAYDPTFRGAEITYPELASRVRLTVHTDELGRIDAVSLDGRELASYLYTGVDRVARRRLANGVETRFAYDEHQRLQRLHLAKTGASQDPAGQPLWSQVVDQSSALGPTALTEIRAGTDPTISRTRFQRDAFGRAENVATSLTLKATSDPTARETTGLASTYKGGQIASSAEYGESALRVDRFTYDPVTRQVQRVETKGSFGGTLNPDASGGVDGIEGSVQDATRTSDGAQEFRYDRNGNVIADGRYRYRYDYKNRLAGVRDTWEPLGYRESVVFRYDALDRRILVMPGRNHGPQTGLQALFDTEWTGAHTWLFYDGNRVIAEVWPNHPATSRTTLLARYFHGAGSAEIVRMDRLPEDDAQGKLGTFYLHEDVNGAIRWVTDEKGALRAITNDDPRPGSGQSNEEKAPGDRLLIENTRVRQPYTAGGTRIDGFAATAYNEELKQSLVNYRVAASYRAAAERQAGREARLALQDKLQLAALAMIGIELAPVLAIEAAPAIAGAAAKVGAAKLAKMAFIGGAINFGFGATKAWVKGEPHGLAEMGLDFAEGAAFGAVGGVIGAMGLNAVAGFSAEVASFTALGTAIDVGVRGADPSEALRANLIGSVVVAGGARAASWVAGKAMAGLLGKATGPAEAELEGLVAAAREERPSALSGTEACVAPVMSFAAGTPVLTERGRAAVETITTGDRVWSRDELTGEETFKRVTGTFASRPSRWVHLRYRPLDGAPIPVASPGDGDDGSLHELIGTPNHPVWSVSRHAWVPMAEIELREHVWLAHGRLAEVVERRLAPTAEGEASASYNFEVEDWHTYFAGDDLVWVHNGPPACRITPGERPHNFRRTTREALMKEYPWAFNRRGEIKYKWAKSESGNWYKAYLYNARHVVGSEAMIVFVEDLMVELGSRELQRRVLARMLKVPLATVTSVKRAARQLYLRLYNNPRNLFMGLATENQDLGREMVGAVRELNLADAPLLDLPKYMEHLLE